MPAYSFGKETLRLRNQYLKDIEGRKRLEVLLCEQVSCFLYLFISDLLKWDSRFADRDMTMRYH